VWPHSRILCSPSPQAALSRAISASSSLVHSRPFLGSKVGIRWQRTEPNEVLEPLPDTQGAIGVVTDHFGLEGRMHRMPIHQSRFDLCAGAIANIDQQRPQFSTFPVREMREGEP
jgi:hypothetical protein